MKLTNSDSRGDRGASMALGHTGPRAGAGPILWKRGDGTEYLAWKVRAPSVIELDPDEEVQIGGEGTSNYVNDAGQLLSVGDVVAINGTTVQLTTSPQYTGPVGVVVAGGEDGEDVLVQTVGYVAQVNVTADVTAGNYAETSGTAGLATESVTRREGSFGVFLTDGSSPSALLFGIPDTSVAVTPVVYLTRDSGERHVFETITAGSAETLDLAAANTFDVTLTDDLTLSVSNPPSSGVEGRWRLVVRGDGSSVVTFPASWVWRDTDGTQTTTAPTLSTAVGGVDVIEFSTLDGATFGASLENGSNGAVASGTERRILLADGHATPFVFTDLLQMDDGSDFLWSD